MIDLAIIPGVASAVGVIYAIMRNGRRSRQQDEELKLELKLEIASVNKKLENPATGLEAIKKSVDEQRLHCAETSTRIEALTNTNAREIINLRNREK